MCRWGYKVTLAGRDHPGRLLSLWEIMKPFYPAILTTLHTSVQIGGSLYAEGPVLLPSETKQQALKQLPFHRKFCADLGLFASTATIDKLLALFSKPDATYGQFQELGKELQGRLDDELFGILFFSLTGAEAQSYINPIIDWEEVIKRWPKTQIDVEESSRCFACARYAAAIFHSLLVAEFGVIEVAKLLGVAGDKPGWAALDRLERILARPYKERSPLEQANTEFLKQNLPLMLAIKDSWRHKISHVDNKLEWLDTDFSPQIAEEIMKATRGFMRRLATELPTASP
jgi:hypothetical protein